MAVTIRSISLNLFAWSCVMGRNQRGMGLAALDGLMWDTIRRAVGVIEWWVPVRVIIVLFVIAVVLRLLGI
jgi:hypothetical protein